MPRLLHVTSLSSLSALLLLSTPLATQGTIVSPAGLATVDGNSFTAFPRWGPGTTWSPRYMQIHSDLGPTPVVIKQLALRQNAGAPAFSGPTTIDAEVYMGSSVSWDQARWVYAANYVLAPTNVVPRTTLNILNVGGMSTPAPFDFKFPFVNAFTYLTGSVAWEIRVHNTTGPQTPNIDAHGSMQGTGNSNLSYGTGCTVTGNTSPMNLSGVGTGAGTAYSIGYLVDRAPPNAPTVLGLGLTNPSLTVPGLCGPVLTDLVATLSMGSTDATGFLGEFQAANAKVPGGINAWAFPNTFPGAQFYVQAHALDLGSASPIKIANSQGRAVIVPAVNLATVVPVTRLYGFPYGLGAMNPNAPYAAGLVGYGVVVEFTY